MKKETPKKAVKKAASKKAIKNTAPKKTKKNKGGRPALYKTPQEMQVKIDEYFKLSEPKILRVEGEVMRDKNGNPLFEYNPPTVSGMALHLGFCDRASMYDYAKKPEFTHTIKMAVTRIEQYAENAILTNSKPVGAIFWLKNHGWRAEEQREDKTKFEGSVTVNDLSKLSDKQLKEMAKAAALDIDDGTEE
ncbi:MAG: terminase small subunit [Candidatus Avelusimicrobium sp.]|uniref:terminase small subunit n=1 Tax=Candidatus Avelusimicrobium sp. TaxID=3048833 RepID=UPI003F098EE9